eukprot:jgi/Bigna1/75254/fgenesh1_pg.33_\
MPSTFFLCKTQCVLNDLQSSSIVVNLLHGGSRLHLHSLSASPIMKRGGRRRQKGGSNKDLLFTCEICDKSFPTKRALGGHRLHCPKSLKKHELKRGDYEGQATKKRDKHAGNKSRKHSTKKTATFRSEDGDESSVGDDTIGDGNQNQKAGRGAERKEGEKENESSGRRKMRKRRLRRNAGSKRKRQVFPDEEAKGREDEGSDKDEITNEQLRLSSESLKEASDLYASAFPNIPKAFQNAAVHSQCNTRLDFRSFRTVVLYLQTGDGQQAVACATVRVHPIVKMLELLFVATNPSHQRKGFGRLLLHLIEDLVISNGIELSLTCASPDAVYFWEKMGFMTNTLASGHGWRLVQMGRTRVMSRALPTDSYTSKMSIAEDLLRLPLSKLRKPPGSHRREKAIPDMRQWILQARRKQMGEAQGEQRRDGLADGDGGDSPEAKASSSSRGGRGRGSKRSRKRIPTFPSSSLIRGAARGGRGGGEEEEEEEERKEGQKWVVQKRTRFELSRSFVNLRKLERSVEEYTSNLNASSIASSRNRDGITSADDGRSSRGGGEVSFFRLPLLQLARHHRWLTTEEAAAAAIDSAVGSSGGGGRERGGGRGGGGGGRGGGGGGGGRGGAGPGNNVSKSHHGVERGNVKKRSSRRIDHSSSDIKTRSSVPAAAAVNITSQCKYSREYDSPIQDHL